MILRGKPKRVAPTGLFTLFLSLSTYLSSVAYALGTTAGRGACRPGGGWGREERTGRPTGFSRGALQSLRYSVGGDDVVLDTPSSSSEAVDEFIKGDLALRSGKELTHLKDVAVATLTTLHCTRGRPVQCGCFGVAAARVGEAEAGARTTVAASLALGWD